MLLCARYISNNSAGLIVEYLKRSGSWERTVFIMMSDNHHGRRRNSNDDDKQRILDKSPHPSLVGKNKKNDNVPGEMKEMESSSSAFMSGGCVLKSLTVLSNAVATINNNNKNPYRSNSLIHPYDLHTVILSMATTSKYEDRTHLLLSLLTSFISDKSEEVSCLVLWALMYIIKLICLIYLQHTCPPFIICYICDDIYDQKIIQPYLLLFLTV
jgi:hypothetical protein